MSLSVNVSSTLQALYESVKARDPDQKEFLQAVEEVRNHCDLSIEEYDDAFNSYGKRSWLCCFSFSPPWVCKSRRAVVSSIMVCWPSHLPVMLRKY